MKPRSGLRSAMVRHPCRARVVPACLLPRARGSRMPCVIRIGGGAAKGWRRTALARGSCRMEKCRRFGAMGVMSGQGRLGCVGGTGRVAEYGGAEGFPYDPTFAAVGAGSEPGSSGPSWLKTALPVLAASWLDSALPVSGSAVAAGGCQSTGPCAAPYAQLANTARDVQRAGASACRGPAGSGPRVTIRSVCYRQRLVHSDACLTDGALLTLRRVPSPPAHAGQARHAGAQATAAWLGLTGTGGPLGTCLCSPGTSGSLST